MFKALIVDDEYYVRVVLKSCLKWEDYGFEIVADLENGEEALDYLSNNHVDLIFTDIEMPFVDGLQLAKEVSEKYKNIHIVFLTCYDKFDYAKNAISYGVKEYLLKPVVAEELGETLEEMRISLEKEQKNIDYTTVSQTILKALHEDLMQKLYKQKSEEIAPFLRSVFEKYTNKKKLNKAIEDEVNNVFKNYCDENCSKWVALEDYANKQEYISYIVNCVTGCCKHKCNHKQELVDKTKKYIEENYMDSSLSLKTIATYMYTNSSYLSRIYNQIAKESISHTINNIRLKNAMMLINQGAKSVELIASRVGYNNASYFSKCFKQEYGVLPSDFISD